MPFWPHLCKDCRFGLVQDADKRLSRIRHTQFFRQAVVAEQANAKLYQDMTKILVKREDIQKAVAQLGREITHDYQGRDLVMVCILKGASVFFSDLIREVDLPVTLDFMALSSYRNSTKSSGVVNLEKDLSVSIKGRDVLIVEE